MPKKIDFYHHNLLIGYDAVQEFEPDFVLQKEHLPEQLRQGLM